MYQYDDPTVASALPTPAAAGTPGYFTPGNPAGGEAATILNADFMNMLMMELLNVTNAGGQTPSKTKYNQVLLAIEQLIAAQAAAVIGAARNAKANAAAGAATCTFTADAIVVGSALGGSNTTIPNFSESLNLAASGAGGVLSGTATANGFLGVYALWGSTAGASIGGLMESGTALPSVLPSGDLPSGYTESALIAVVPTNTAAGQFAAFTLNNRRVRIVPSVATSGNTTSTSSTYSALPLTAVPYSANQAYTTASVTTGASVGSMSVASTSTGVGAEFFNSNFSNVSGGGGNSGPLPGIDIVTARTIYFFANTSNGTSVAYNLNVSGYEF